MASSGQTLAELAAPVHDYPQELVNVKVENKKAAMKNETLLAAIDKVEHRLHGDGRVLVRASGTEPLIRIMAEAPTKEQCHDIVTEIFEVAKATVGVE